MNAFRYGLILVILLIGMTAFAAGKSPGFSASATSLNFYFNADPSVYTYTGSTINAAATVQISIVEEGTFNPSVHTHPSWTVSISGPNPNNPQQTITVTTVSFTHPGSPTGCYTNSNVVITLPAGPGSFTYTASLTGGEGSAGSVSDTATIPLDLAIASAKSAICAGAIQNAPHQSVISATLTSNGQAVSGKTVTFSLTNSNATYPASLSATTATTNSSGVAQVTLTSSQKLNATAKVKATYGNLEQETGSITMGDCSGAWSITPDVIIADGSSQATVKLTLTFSGAAVGGHQITWRINRVWDVNNTLVYVADPQSGSLDGYGSISPTTGSTNTTTGEVTTTYTAGINGGTIEFMALDYSVVENSPKKWSSPTTSLTPLHFYVYIDPSGSGSVTPTTNTTATGGVSGTRSTMAFKIAFLAKIKRLASSTPTQHIMFQPKRVPYPGQAINACEGIVYSSTTDDTSTTGYNEAIVSSSEGGVDYKTYTYRSNRPAWDVTQLQGKYCIYVKYFDGTVPSPADQDYAYYKIDKRQQVVQLATSWLGATSIQFCNNFANTVYNHLGLDLIVASVDEQFYSDYPTNTQERLLTSYGAGCLLYYNMYNRTPWNPAHVAIYMGDGTRIDVNGYPNGRTFLVSRQGLTDGCGTNYDYDIRERSTVNLDGD